MTTEETQDASEKALRREAYSAAMSRLRETHTAEFAALHEQEIKQRGLTWKPRLNPEQRAAETVSALFAEHPELAQRLGYAQIP